MRFIIFLATICLFVWFGTASPVNLQRQLINRPSEDKIFDLERHKRYTFNNMNVKERNQPTHHRPQQAMESNIRKGEYICHSRICKLKPGDVPKGCNGLCQHAV